jgi:cytochrome d ubiquinol oxidase subunit I
MGAQSADVVTQHQPAKLAAMEGVWETQSCAPMFIIGWVDEEAQTTTGLSIPCLLSLLAHRDINGVVIGLNDIPEEEHPSVNLVFQSYHVMINLGVAMVGLGVLGMGLYWWKRRIFEMRWVLWLFVLSIFLAELATVTGWWTAEMGRQPWIVYGLLRVEDAVSPGLTSGQVLFSLVVFILLYILLFILFIYLLNAKIQHGPAPLKQDVEDIQSLPDTFREVFRSGARSQIGGDEHGT